MLLHVSYLVNNMYIIICLLNKISIHEHQDWQREMNHHAPQLTTAPHTHTAYNLPVFCLASAHGNKPHTHLFSAQKTENTGYHSSDWNNPSFAILMTT